MTYMDNNPEMHTEAHVGAVVDAMSIARATEGQRLAKREIPFWAKTTAGLTLTAAVLAACGGDSDSDATPAPSVGEAIVVDAGSIDPALCASDFATDTFTYGVDSEGSVVQEGDTNTSEEVSRPYVPQSVAALLPVDYDKASAGDDGYRAWGDAVSTPIAGDTLEENKVDVYKKLCEDPLYLEHMISGFAQVIGTSGEPLANNNEWMQGASVETIDDRAESKYWNFSVLNQTTQDRSTLTNSEIINRMNGHEERAALMITMLERFFEADNYAESAVAVEHIALVGPEVSTDPNDLPEMTDQKPDYVGNFIIFTYNDKDGRCVEVALNLGDGRFAEIVDGVCIQQGDITTTTTHTTPGTTPGTTTTTTPGTPVTTTTVPTGPGKPPIPGSTTPPPPVTVEPAPETTLGTVPATAPEDPTPPDITIIDTPPPTNTIQLPDEPMTTDTAPATSAPAAEPVDVVVTTPTGTVVQEVGPEDTVATGTTPSR